MKINMNSSRTDTGGVKMTEEDVKKHENVIRNQNILAQREITPSDLEIVEVGQPHMTYDQACDTLRASGYTDTEIQELIKEGKLLLHKRKGRNEEEDTKIQELIKVGKYEPIVLTSTVQYLEVLKGLNARDTDKSEAA